MATILVFNTDTGALERYERDASQPMPYNVGGTLTVREFLKSASFGYTDTATMASWNKVRSTFGRPIRVDRAFVSIADGACAEDRQSFAGTSFLMGSNLDRSGVEELYGAATTDGDFSYVSPLGRADVSVAADKRYMPSNTFLTAGFPTLYKGCRGNYVALAQDALSATGYSPGSTDGIFGPLTDAAVRAFERDRRLSEDGIVGSYEWESLLNMNCPPQSTEDGAAQKTPRTPESSWRA